MRTSNRLAVLLVAAGAAVGASTSHGQVVVTTDAQNGASPFTPTYTPSSSDLINGLPTTAEAESGLFSRESAAGTSALTNGAFGTIDRSLGEGPRNAIFATAGMDTDAAQGGITPGGTTLTYTLPGAAGVGYNLSSIAVYGGWQDGGRDEQSYTISYATAAAPGTFLPLSSVDFNPSGLPNGSTPSATRVTFTSPTGTLATGVAALRFDFTETENGYSGYAEIDVFGTPVPEPTSLGLLGLGALGLLARRRRL